MTSPDGSGRPCGWPDPSPVNCSAWSSATSEIQAWAAGVAASVLWSLSGRRLGVCDTVAFPTPSRACRGLTTYRGPVTGPLYLAGLWTVDLCGCGWTCPSRIVHLAGPVVDVEQVAVDDVVLPESAYRLNPGGVLVRVDGAYWPHQDNILTVTYRRGEQLDQAALSAYSRYACELVKSAAGDSSCKLPQRIQQLTREGVTVAFQDPFEFLDAGRTGVPEVDVWLSAVNPDRLRQPSAVYTPDRRYG